MVAFPTEKKTYVKHRVEIKNMLIIQVLLVRRQSSVH